MLLLSMMIGCSAKRTTPGNIDMFAPTGMRIHPIFTQVADLDKDGKPDGIEAQLEFQDQFGDPTKASGQVLFELFDYRRNSPDPAAPGSAGRGWNLWPGSTSSMLAGIQRCERIGLT